MRYSEKTIEELGRKAAAVTGKLAIVGLDGFVDKIMIPIDRRTGMGTNYVPFPGMEAFGQRIVDFAGKSCNIELYPHMEKLGGNGPIMANSLAAAGMQVRYIGALGHGVVHPVFDDFARRTKAVSLADPGVTHALEFDDGKIMLGTMASLDEVTYERIIERMGEGAFFDEVNRADLVSMVNWTMIPQMTSVLEALLDRVLPNIPPKDGGRIFFFDLADPKKRTEGEILRVLEIIGRYRSHGRVILGLNLAEAQQVAGVLGLPAVENSEAGLTRTAERVRQRLELTCCLVHPRDSAACALREGSWYTPGPLCDKPLITTGAGDHFNAGFVTGQLLGLSPEASLTVAVAFSGQYVRTGKSPSLADTDAFLRNWKG